MMNDHDLWRHQAHQERCPYLNFDLWEKINQGSERCLVELTFVNGMKMEVPFYDGCCGTPGLRLEDVVDVEVIVSA